MQFAYSQKTEELRARQSRGGDGFQGRHTGRHQQLQLTLVGPARFCMRRGGVGANDHFGSRLVAESGEFSHVYEAGNVRFGGSFVACLLLEDRERWGNKDPLTDDQVQERPDARRLIEVDRGPEPVPKLMARGGVFADGGFELRGGFRFGQGRAKGGHVLDAAHARANRSIGIHQLQVRCDEHVLPRGRLAGGGDVLQRQPHIDLDGRSTGGHMLIDGADRVLGARDDDGLIGIRGRMGVEVGAAQENAGHHRFRCARRRRSETDGPDRGTK